MLIEVKARVTRIIEGKTRRKVETFLIPQCELFTHAEYQVLQLLTEEQNMGTVESSEILSLRQSPIKEVYTQYTGDSTFIATLKDVFLDDAGNEKPIKYKVLLWADSISEANRNIQQIASQGYDMHVEGLKEVEYEYLTGNNNGQSE